MVKFKVRDHFRQWDNFIAYYEALDRPIDNLTDTEFNIWLENKLAIHNAYDDPASHEDIYFRSNEDAVIFLLRFS